MSASNLMRNPAVAWTEVADSIFLVSPWNSVLHELNSSAGFLWKQASGERSTAELAHMLASEYELDEATAEQDASELISRLEAEELLVRVTAAAEQPNRG